VNKTKVLALAVLLALAGFLQTPHVVRAAAGDRKIQLLALNIPTPAGGDVVAEIRWRLLIEDRVAQDKEVIGGNLSLNLGTWGGGASAMTLAQIRTSALAALNSNGTIPPHDSAN